MIGREEVALPRGGAPVGPAGEVRSVVVVTPLLPWPPRDGGRIGIAFRLRELWRRGIRVRLFAVHLPTESTELGDLARWCEDVVLVERPARGAALLRRPLEPYAFATRDLPALHRQLARAIASDRPDVVHLEQTLMGGYRASVPADLPLVLGVHNLEHRAIAGQARSLSWQPRQAVYWLEALRMLRAERALFSDTRWRAIAFVSAEEQEWVRTRFPALADRLHYLPPGCDLPPAPVGVAAREPCVAFVGGLWFQPNIDGLLWFIDHGWPEVRRRVPGARLLVAGRGASAELAARLQAAAGVELVGEVPDVQPTYDRARVVVLPIRHGAGVKVKTIEALGTGLPCAGLVHAFDGLSGLGDEARIACTTPQALGSAIAGLLGDPVGAEAIGRAGRAYVERTSTWDIIGSRYVEILREAVRRG